MAESRVGYGFMQNPMGLLCRLIKRTLDCVAPHFSSSSCIFGEVGGYCELRYFLLAGVISV